MTTVLTACSSSDDGNSPASSGGAAGVGTGGSGAVGAIGGAAGGGGTNSGGGAGTGSGGSGTGGSGTGGSGTGGNGTGGAGTGGSGTGGSGTGGNAGGGPWSYPGVPYPTDNVPTGIMPTLPTAAAKKAGWPYDPTQVATPSPSGAADEYVVSTSGNDQSAGNGGKGTTAAPRRTIPKGTFPAGTKIFVLGKNSAYGTVDFNIGENTSMTFDCTAAAPCWLIGIDRPRIGRRIDVANSHHLLMDGFSLVDIPGGNRPYGQMNVSNSTFIAHRNVEIRGSGANSAGGSLLSISNTEFLITYQSSIHDGGSWNSNATGLDVHGWRPLYGNRYLWLIDSTLYHLQADGVQCGNSNNGNPQSASSHYVYIAGNEFYENYENALDNKNSYHVVFSSNDVHDFYAAPGASGANNTAIILSNNSEGPWTGYHWAIDNRVWSTGLAIRDSGSETGEKNYAVGNIIWNASTAFLQANNSANRESWFINNSVSGSSTAVDVNQPGSNASLFVRLNVFDGAGTLDTMSAVNSVLSGNVLYGTTVKGAWDTNSGNLTGNPMLKNASQGDMTPGAGSSAVGAGSEDPVFALFTSLYGLDIREDLNGTTRPSGSWDIGAIEVP
ncbi:MAG: hypothetical protein R3B13_28005 [Polyangiaceae bacterium]